ncbi:MAG: FecR family protein, partial [Oscillospiraceae bacterium]|jgi:hypothetical protein|nr:FecR family protein [Oscillospiraceae bacterium]
VEDLQGDVTATQSGDTFAAFTGLALQNSDTLATGASSWTSLELGAGQYVLVEENTELQVGNWELTEGKAWFNVNSPLEVTTPNASLSVRGTVFYIAHAGGVTRIAVFDGVVNANGADISNRAAEIDQDGELTLYDLTEDDYRSEYFSERLRDWPGLTGEVSPSPSPSPSPSQGATAPPAAGDIVYTDGATTVTLYSNGNIYIEESDGISGNGPPASGWLPAEYCSRNGDVITGIVDATGLEDPNSGRYYSERMLYSLTISGDTLSYRRSHILNYEGILGEWGDVTVFSVSATLRRSG